MNLGGFRAEVVAALEVVDEIAGEPVEILEAPVDAVSPPALIVQWGPDPWLAIDSVCTDIAQLEIVAVAGRLTPEANLPILEDLVDAVRAALAVARLRPWQTLRPGPLEVAGVGYLAARIHIRRPVTTGYQEVNP